ncbi:MAG: hypothetical protein ABFC80_00930 [Coriobacteriales bacterium]
MRKYTTAILVTTLATLAVMGVSACTSSDGTSTGGTTQETTAATGAEQGTTAEQGTDARAHPEALPVGTVGKVGDWEVKIESVNAHADEELAAFNSYNTPPPAGQQFVLITLQAKYTGEDSDSFWADVVYKFYGSKGTVIEEGGAAPPNPVWSTKEVGPGETSIADLVFQVPSDEVDGGSLMLRLAGAPEDSGVFFGLQ